MLTLLAMFMGIILDDVFAEPKRFHPLLGFGLLANKIEDYFNVLPSAQLNTNKSHQIIRGGLAWCIAVLPAVFVVHMVQETLTPHPIWQTIFMGVMVYLAIAWRSLIQHAMAIYKPLSQADITSARYAVSMIVSRETEQMTQPEIVTAATESVLENGADAVFSALFWFMLFGVPGLVLYRLSNTLDAMWGYKNARYTHFGFAAAKIDDVLNYIPARITACLYACASFNRQLFMQAIDCWRTQAKACSSPNGGPVMCAGAGAINVELGGSAIYYGEWVEKPPMGKCIQLAKSSLEANKEGWVEPLVILRACELLSRSVYICVGFIAISIFLLFIASY